MPMSDLSPRSRCCHRPQSAAHLQAAGCLQAPPLSPPGRLLTSWIQAPSRKHMRFSEGVLPFLSNLAALSSEPLHATTKTTRKLLLAVRLGPVRRVLCDSSNSARSQYHTTVGISKRRHAAALERVDGRLAYPAGMPRHTCQQRASHNSYNCGVRVRGCSTCAIQ
jgi:hypothetical protein